MKQLHSIHLLRAIAALLVVAHHSIGNVAKHYRSDFFLDSFYAAHEFGAVGVDLFFVISGVIMIYIGHHKFGEKGGALTFFRQRIWRIVPLYWLYSGIMALFFILPFTLRGTTISTADAIRSLLFIPMEREPLLAAGWTLTYELYFYLLFSMALIGKRRHYLPFISAIILGSIAVGLWLQPSAPVLKIVLSPLLFEFLLGTALGSAYVNQKRLPQWLCITATAIGTSALLCTIITGHHYAHRTISWGIPSALLVGGLLFSERNHPFTPPKLLSIIGDSSYTLYLSHLITLLFCSALIGSALFPKGLSGTLLTLLCSGACVLVSLPLYHLIEKRLHPVRPKA